MSAKTWFLMGLLTVIGGGNVQAVEEDLYLWLEEVESEKALTWAKEQNAKSAELKKDDRFEPIHDRLLEIYNSDDRIPHVSIRGPYLYNFWQDEVNKRGLWRRTTLDEYAKPDPTWETMVDVDSLSQAEDEDWVFKGTTYLEPNFDRVILELSRGGADAVVMREFDTVEKAFVEDGFRLEEAKSGVSWKDKNTLYVGTDFGSDTKTDSGYPRIAKIWRRGQSLENADTVLEGEKTDVSVWSSVLVTPERHYDIIGRSIEFYKTEIFTIEHGELVRIDIPLDANLITVFKGQMLVRLKSDWEVNEETYTQGSLIAIDYDRFLEGDRDFTIVVEPDERNSIEDVGRTRDLLLVNMLSNVRGELFEYRFEDSLWLHQRVDAPENGTILLGGQDESSNRYFFYFEGFIHPRSLYFVAEGGTVPVQLKSLPEFFDADGLTVDQYEVASKDGTKIPYFVVHRGNAQAAPTLLYGYGGFEISIKPTYLSAPGSAWLEHGGAYAVANIRGGGEFGPKWHVSTLKENRQLCYDDFAAVAEDIAKRGITTPKQLGIKGGSNGGLLVGVAFTQRPDLYNAVVCAVPLLDMKRYNKLLAGASWMAEYGDPDIPEEWAYIKKYSPYHNLDPHASYPRVFFYTSTRDDRVHPGHARKMVARMQEMGHDVIYYENIEGGHAAATTNEQRAFIDALQYTYLWGELGGTP